MASGRVHVIGGPGAGKTTVGQRLATRLTVPYLDLDRVAAYRPPKGRHEDVPFGHWERVPWDERLAIAHKLASQQGWVSEGVYAGWTEPLVSRADVVVWLDTPGWLAASRVLRRHLGRMAHGDADAYDLRPLVFLMRRAALGYRRGPVGDDEALRLRDSANSSATIAAFLDPHIEKVRRCVTKRATDRTIDEVVYLLTR